MLLPALRQALNLSQNAIGHSPVTIF